MGEAYEELTENQRNVLEFLIDGAWVKPVTVGTVLGQKADKRAASAWAGAVLRSLTTRGWVEKVEKGVYRATPAGCERALIRDDAGSITLLGNECVLRQCRVLGITMYRWRVLKLPFMATVMVDSPFSQDCRCRLNLADVRGYEGFLLYSLRATDVQEGADILNKAAAGIVRNMLSIGEYE